MHRRHFLSSLAAAGASTWLGSARAGIRPFRELDVRVSGHPDIAQRALVLVPRHLDPNERHPLLVLLHGFGQASTETRSVRAWVDEYGLAESYDALCAPPIRPRERARYLTPERAADMSRELDETPFRGCVIACPVTPVPYYQKRAGSAYRLFAKWLDEALLPEVRRLAPVTSDPARCALAGVSMGGLVGVETAIRRPDLFGAFCGVQMAVREKQARHTARRLARAVDGDGCLQELRLHTSTGDTYRRAIEHIYGNLVSAGIASELSVSPGPHTRVWMQRVGTLETLLWADRVLHPARNRRLARS